MEKNKSEQAVGFKGALPDEPTNDVEFAINLVGFPRSQGNATVETPDFLSGPPGAGKTQASALAARQLAANVAAQPATTWRIGQHPILNISMPPIIGGGEKDSLQQRLDNGESASAIIESEVQATLSQYSERRKNVGILAASLGMKVVDYQPGMDVSAFDKDTFVYATADIQPGPDSNDIGPPKNDGPST